MAPWPAARVAEPTEAEELQETRWPHEIVNGAQTADRTRQKLDRDMSARSQGADRYAGRNASVGAMRQGGGRRS